MPDTYNVLYKDEGIEKEIKDKNLLINKKLEEFDSLVGKNLFYVGHGISNSIAWYIRLALAAKSFEESFAYRAKDDLNFEEKRGNEKTRKEMEERLNKEREELNTVKESLWKDMEKYRFTYGAARRYSLEYQP